MEQFHLGTAIEPVAVDFLDNADAAQATEVEIESTVWQTLVIEDSSETGDGMKGRPTFVIRFPTGLQQSHGDELIPRQGIAHHLSVAGLENVQRQHHVRKQ